MLLRCDRLRFSQENKEMASKGPRSKLDHETRARRQKALEAPREPPRPKSHWDHVLEEMVWLSKDFESERKWKLAQAKKVAIKASKSILDHATRGEKKVKEEEQRLKKTALNISKDVKKFWIKIEKLVLYKHQLELEERKKMARDKQLDFLLGQTERYSTMLAENLVDMPHSFKAVNVDSEMNTPPDMNKDKKICLEGSTQDPATKLDNMETDSYGIQSEDDLEDDEHTIDEDEAQISEGERREELAALQDEVDLPLEELLKNYTKNRVSREASPENSENVTGLKTNKEHQINDSCNQVNGSKHVWESPDHAVSEEYNSIGKMIENSHSSNDFNHNHQRQGGSNGDYSFKGDQLAPKTTKKSNPNKIIMLDEEHSHLCSDDELDDREYNGVVDEEKDDETTLSEEEALAEKEVADPVNEINLLQQESEMSIEELLARYIKDDHADGDTADSEYSSSSSDDQVDCTIQPDIQVSNLGPSVPEGGFEHEEPSKHKELKRKEPCSTMTELAVEHDNKIDGRESEDIIADAAAAARSAQPTGNTFSTTKVRTTFPFLLKHPMREYQHIGLDWLVTMYEKRLNGILADEMGLGKTIMTIALLAHLACEKGIWGPHLIVVPTSVMLNWETEFLKWCPAFKILTYFGSAKERKHKRQGWLKLNSFHICITTYRLVIQDSKVFKRKKWKYLILDEAHLIKNWKSQRWQTLLNFNSKRRILLTGTPLQNDLMELWSLMHFLMPHVFQSHQEFKDWFSNPISGMVDGQEKVNKEVVDRLHNVLRPFLLRRLKRDVEKQLPKKYEHVIYCRLSRRQRNLYEDFIASSETQATLASANYFGMISVIMQLRKVCNHPDLFEGRPIISSFDMSGIDMQVCSSVCEILSAGPFSEVDLRGLNLVFTQHEFNMTSWEIGEITEITCPFTLNEENDIDVFTGGSFTNHVKNDPRRRTHGCNIFEKIQKDLWEERMKLSEERAASISWWNSLRCQKKPFYGTNIRELVTVKHPVFDIHEQKINPSRYMEFSSRLAEMLLSPVERLHQMLDLIECFMFAIPASRAPLPVCWCNKGRSPVLLHSDYKEECTKVLAPLLSPIRPAIVRRQVYFPDRRLIQFDCGKLQELAILLRRLKSEGHRALIFTQMTKMLDTLEAFISLYGYTYMRLDGSTPPEERQTLMQRFNTNPKFFLFILSTRSGGVGINLVGADTVIFYDSDWNPAMDQQAQDRCHRIGQTREVHIYRLISESTIEENILKKANQKRALDDLVIQSGSYNTEFFKKLDPMELISGQGSRPIENLREGSSTAECPNSGMEMLLSNADVEEAIKHAEDEADYIALKKVEQEEAVDNQEFTEEAVGRLDEDDLANDDDIRPGERTAEEQGCVGPTVSKEGDITLCDSNVHEEKSLTLSVGDDDIDMLADVKQLAAAAAAAGQASSSFENQLRPIDRYAMRFLDLWDPVIDKSAIDFQVNVEGEEWELDRIEKFKEDLEAEIDEDQEPFLYERWDADFATKAYRQHVEALAQQQLQLEELEKEVEDANQADKENGVVAIREVSSVEGNKKSKKRRKYRLLPKEARASELEIVREESPINQLSNDDKASSPEVFHEETPRPPLKKRKKVLVAEVEEKNPRKGSKKHKKAPENDSIVNSSSTVNRPVENGEPKSGEVADELDHKPTSRSKSAGKISIPLTPVRRVMVVKPERLKKKGHVWSKDCFPSPDTWSPQEDAVLCSTVHEYGTHWSLASNALYDFPGGGFFRGRFRHPVHCCERFRELFYKYVQSTGDSSSTEKATSSGSGKALLKVTEDHVRTLLNVTSELPDNELLLQKHFVAVISSVWRAKCRLERYRCSPSSRSRYSRSFSYSYEQKPGKLTENISPATLRQSSKLIMTALSAVCGIHQEEPLVVSNQLEIHTKAEQVDLLLDFSTDAVQYGNDFPSTVILSVHGPDPPVEANEPIKQWLVAEISRRNAENRFSAASEACFEGEGVAWATSAFPTYDVRNRSNSKFQSSGKHKAVSDLGKPPKSKVPKNAEAVEEPASASKPLLPLPRPSPRHLEYGDMPLFISDSFSDCSHFSSMDMLLETGQTDFFVPEYDSSFCAGLEDLGLLEDITDIG